MSFESSNQITWSSIQYVMCPGTCPSSRERPRAYRLEKVDGVPASPSADFGCSLWGVTSTCFSYPISDEALCE
jgi:hypothetical protein